MVLLLSWVCLCERNDLEVIEEGRFAVVTYVGTLDDGSCFGSTENLPPLRFQVGAHQVVSGFEDEVRQMQVGETKTVHIPPERAYGFYDEMMVEEAPMMSVPQFADKKIGENFIIQRDGMMVYCKISKILNGVGTFDFNHPLAGQTLHFTITLHAVE